MSTEIRSEADSKKGVVKFGQRDAMYHVVDDKFQYDTLDCVEWVPVNCLQPISRTGWDTLGADI